MWEWNPNVWRSVVLVLSLASVACAIVRQYYKDQWF